MGDAWYDGDDTRVSDGIVYRRLPSSFYSLENPPNQNVLQTLFDKCDLDQHFKALFLVEEEEEDFFAPMDLELGRIDKERLYSFRVQRGNWNPDPKESQEIHLQRLVLTDSGWHYRLTPPNYWLVEVFCNGQETQPIIFVPESLYDIVVTPLVEFKSLTALALQGVREIEVSDLNDASECRAFFGDNIWVCWSRFIYRPDPGGLPEDDESFTIKRAAEAKFYISKDYGPYYIAEFHNDWREVALKNMRKSPWKYVCIFGMPEKRIQEYKDAHPELVFVDYHHKWHNVVLMSGPVSRKAAFIAQHSVRDWAA